MNRWRAALAAGLLGVLLTGMGEPRALARAGSARAEALGSLDGFKLYLRATTVDTSALADLRQGSGEAFESSRPYVLQLIGPMTPARRAALLAVGVTFHDYLPLHAYIVRLDEVSPADLAPLPFVQWVGTYRNEWKVDPTIGRRLRPFQSRRRIDLAKQGRLKLNVVLLAGFGLDQAMADLARLGASVLAGYELGGQGTVELIAEAGLIDVLASQPFIQFVEEAPEITLRNNTTRWIIQSNVTNVTPLYDSGITGLGQIVGVLDGKVDADHCSFFDVNPIGPTHRKIEAYNATPGAYDHGTHVAGTAVGDAGSPSNTRGIAYEGRLVYNTVPWYTETAMVDRLTTHHNQGARIHTNSWGDDGTTAYNGLARGIDVFSYDHEDDLILFAVTNTDSLRNPENAKNLLAVGATQDTPSQGSHCTGGTGPTGDGRRKPEIYAPGCSTISANGNTSCDTRTMTGTSMACPAVAGMAMLVRQYYQDGYYPSGVPNQADAISPTGALVKATLLNAAVDMTGVSGYPSNQEGWGRVLADDALFFPGDTRKLLVLGDIRNTDGLSTGEQAEYALGVLGSLEKLKVTLVWTDPPAASGASFAAVNNLDLEVESPSGLLYRGNVFSGGVSIPGQTADDRNNVEQVHIAMPSTGTWTIRVQAAAVNVAAQGYALVATGDIGLEVAALSIRLPDGAPEHLPPRTAFSFDVQITPGSENVVPESPALHYRYGGGAFETEALAPKGGDLFVATLPPARCADLPEFYVSADGDGGSVVTNPPTAPSALYTPAVGVESVSFADDFQSDLGWAVSSDAGTDGEWQRGVPMGNGARGDPLHDYDDSGRCYLTGNADGDSDVDGGSTELTSPIIDLTGLADPQVNYARWYANTRGPYPEADLLVVEVSDDGGASWAELEIVGPTLGSPNPEVDGGWFVKTFRIGDVVALTDRFRARFVASDLGAESVVEAAVDAFTVTDFSCHDDKANDGDLDGDNDVDLSDYTRLSACLAGPGVKSQPGGCDPDDFAAADIDGDDDVDEADISIFYNAFTGE